MYFLRAVKSTFLDLKIRALMYITYLPLHSQLRSGYLFLETLNKTVKFKTQHNNCQSILHYSNRQYVTST